MSKLVATIFNPMQINYFKQRVNEFLRLFYILFSKNKPFFKPDILLIQKSIQIEQFKHY